ncbi:MAG: hypothetical protein CYPHOPRED_004487 [Cyphobasidiales sp. Tagirdzhanova-0007]|nr:MAG: hypothetical protein CYPHOPRED_004487 [Cyphobasidiales sp. Tagirdzhanova-0007]
MPPKGSKRAAPKEAAMEVEEEGSDSLRRSTRGGGHKAPEAKTAKLRSVSSKKAKTAAVDGKAEEGGAAGDVGSGSASGTGNGNGVAAPPTAPTADGVAEGVPTEEKGVPVPENNIDAAKETESKTKSGKIEVGEILPAGIVLKNEQDEDVTIADLTKEKGAVFFVYPKANTPGCTNQACDFRDNYAEFGPLGYDVYGLSADSPKSQASWKEKHNFNYHLLCDPAQILTKILGAARSGNSKNQRSHYVVEKGGKLVDAKYTIGPKDSCKAALDFIKGQTKE